MIGMGNGFKKVRQTFWATFAAEARKADAVPSPNSGIRGNLTLVARSTPFWVSEPFQREEITTLNIQMPLEIVSRVFLGVLFPFVGIYPTEV
jgi:hypothetical protein